jgi:hypothetical protein
MKLWIANLETSHKVAWILLIVFFLVSLPFIWPLYLIVGGISILVWALVAVIESVGV